MLWNITIRIPHLILVAKILSYQKKNKTQQQMFSHTGFVEAEFQKLSREKL